MTTRGTSVLVLGVGNPDRGDDAVGPAVAERIAALDLPGVRVSSPAEPMDLLAVPAGADLVVLVDAVRTGAEPGALLVREVGHAQLTEWSAATSTHLMGVAETVELARALGRMPDRLVLVGVEAVDFVAGTPMSPAVRDAVPTAADAVLRAVGSVPGGAR